jgi:hypothetical protein
MNIPDNATSISLLAVAVDDVRRGINGQLGSPITPGAPYKGGTVRELLAALRNDIDQFLK